MLRIGYLSAAPRVSTNQDARTSGPRAHILGVINAFKRLGCQVETFIVGDRLPIQTVNHYSSIATRSGLTLFFLDIARITMGLINSWKAYKELKPKVDIVYERYAVLQCLGWIFRRRYIPWVLETNGLFYYEAKTERKSLILSGLAKWMEIKAFQSCNLLICVSEPLKQLIIKETGLLASKILVVPNAVDISFLDPLKFTSRRIFAGFTVGYVGSLINWQGLDQIIKAIHCLRIEKNIRINLVIVGDGPMRLEWETLSKELGLDYQIYFAGHVNYSEIPEYIAGFDVGYSGQIPLKIGSMYMSPLKLYEYMALAKPVLASAFDDAKTLVKPDETGFLYEPTDIEDLKRVLIRCYEQRDHLQKMGQLARTEVVQRHSWEVRVQKVIAAMEKIMEESDGHKEINSIRSFN